MGNDENRLHPDEIAVSIKRLLEQCLKKIKFIILMAIIFAVALTTIFYGISLKEYEAQKNQVLKEPEEIELTKEDTIIINKYFLFKERVAKYESKLENIAKLQLNYENVYEVKLQYYADISNQGNVDAINIILDYLKNDELFNVKENDIAQLKVESGREKTGVESGILTINVWANDSIVCKEIAEKAKGIFSSYVKVLQDKVGDCSFVLVNEGYSEGYSEDLYRATKQIYDSYHSIKNEYATCKTALTENQKKAIAEIENIDVENDNQDVAKVEIPKPKLEVKFAVLGFVVGAFIAVVAVILFTLLGGKLQTPEEISRRIDYEILGILDSKKDKICRTIDGVELAISTKGVKSFSIISTESIAEDALINEISSAFVKKGIKIDFYDHITEDVQILSKLKTADYVLVVEILGKTKVKNLYELEKICNQVGTNVLGYVVISE